MIETKYLEKFIKEGKIELFKHRRELLILPNDSGRLNIIVSQAHLFNNILYLCDSRKSKKQIEDELAKTNVTNITVLTYDELYDETIGNYDFIYEYLKSFDLIVCDNIHNLIIFSKQVDYLKYIVCLLFDNAFKYNAKILMMTNEPQYIEEFQHEMPWANSYHIIDLKDNLCLFNCIFKKIKKYLNYMFRTNNTGI